MQTHASGSGVNEGSLKTNAAAQARSQYVRLVSISEVVAVQASAFFGQKKFRKFLPDAAETAYDLDASNLSISCESEEPISSYFGRGSSLQKRVFETEFGAPRL